MKKNLGKIDRTIRVIVGLAILALGAANGTWLGLIGLVWVALLRRHPQRFALTLAFISAGMFGISIFRADRMPLWFGLRADQVLDIFTITVSLLWVGWTAIKRTRKEHANGF